MKKDESIWAFPGAPESKMILIGMHGVAGSGKDTAANFLKANFDFKSVAFADPLRAGLSAITGLTMEHYEHPIKDEILEVFGKSPRQMLQTLGTDWGRDKVNQDLWLILANLKVKAFHADYYPVVITDVRFENEAEYVRQQGGVVWHIKRDTAGTKHTHASEAGVKFVEGDVLIDNNSTFGALYTQILENL